jgi:hypothetical protein
MMNDLDFLLLSFSLSHTVGVGELRKICLCVVERAVMRWDELHPGKAEPYVCLKVLS